jgi:hypothetical protein
MNNQNDEKLFNEIVNIIAASGHPRPEYWVIFYNTQFRDKNKTNLSEFWGTTIAKWMGPNDQTLRFGLIKETSNKEFLDNFRSGIAPAIIKYQIYF